VIRACNEQQLSEILEVVNDAAEAYKRVLPADVCHDPYMTLEELRHQLASGVAFHGWYEDGRLEAVMGCQTVLDATLIRHAYVRSRAQGRGIGARLLRELVANSSARVLVGTWAAASWAIRFYERHGFRLVSAPKADQLLQKYWTVPQRQREMSVVLEYGNYSRARAASS
jgi:GNAT superfamily N-acetyltransferase